MEEGFATFLDQDIKIEKVNQKTPEKPSIKASTVICFKCFHICRSGSKISVHIR